ncbi:hypothetical protein NMY3_01215 [Candidatus Nitrosocosmicus oleophilus]|uniref:Uncharacterized protein n=1 Tax=Candidatus Nitrosocosmicus oleophilus TaxID=1353260 RepID=A0A654LX74_9ARCH|nr:hypothetical protein [Candidatus Nitrosocosmicus oleophilus]ALI35420.1 hypothetical protein NMY3_01215 [Candidatus Nitrosocosmicus oleophilus]
METSYKKNIGLVIFLIATTGVIVTNNDLVFAQSEGCNGHEVYVNLDLTSFAQGSLIVGVTADLTGDVVLKEVFDSPDSYQVQSFTGCMYVAKGDTLTACAVVKATSGTICQEQSAFGSSTSFFLDLDQQVYPNQYDQNNYSTEESFSENGHIEDIYGDSNLF